MKTNRAYSVLTVKGMDEEKREITGMATTPTPDRMQDIVEPAGATYKLPVPLLWQHNSNQPIGEVIAARVTPKGIEITAKFAQIDVPGKLKDRLDEAWQSVKAGLVRGLSIGFRGLETSEIKDTWGIRFSKWEWLELSAVTIPANAEASIQTIKSVDHEVLAASGTEEDEGVTRGDPPPGAPGKSKSAAPRGFFFARSKGTDMKTRAEQIAALEAARQAKAARQEAIMTKAQEESRTTNDEERDEFATLEAEMKAADTDLQMLKTLEARSAATATPVSKAAGTNPAEAAASRAGGSILSVKSNLPPGIAFAQYVKCLGMAHGNRMEAMEIAKNTPRLDPRVALVAKAAVVAGSTASGNWAENLVGDETSVYADFVEFLRPQTIIGKFGNGGIPSFRRIPFRVPLIGQTGGGEGYWVGEGQAKPLTAFDFSRTTLEPLKVANIAVLTEEALRDSSPSADMIVRDSLVAALRERLDKDFILPTKAPQAGISPGSITNGVTPVASSGTDADAVRRDIKALLGTFIAANNAPTSGVWVMSSNLALSLSLMTNALGQPEFNGLTMNGGTFQGMPVITSEYLVGSSSGSFVALVNAADVYMADEGGFMVDVSRDASLLMADNPNMNSTTPTGASLVSMFQTNSVAFRAERTIDWARRRPSAVAVLTGVNWA